MKNNWIIKIGIATFVSFMLAAVFAKIAGDEKMNNYGQELANKLTNEGENVSIFTEETFATDAIDEINIMADAIKIKIEKSADDRIHFLYYKKNEASKGLLTNIEESVLNFQLDKLIYPKRKLKINFNFSKFNDLGIAAHDAKESAVVIQIPEKIKKLKIDAVSSNIKVTAGKLAEVVIKLVSGYVELQGDIKAIKTSSVSGDIEIESGLADPKVEISTISGDVKFIFNKSPDINLTVATTSGGIHIDSDLYNGNFEGSINELKLGKGTSQFKVDTVSGDFEIHQNRN